MEAVWGFLFFSSEEEDKKEYFKSPFSVSPFSEFPPEVPSIRRVSLRRKPPGHEGSFKGTEGKARPKAGWHTPSLPPSPHLQRWLLVGKKWSENPPSKEINLAINLRLRGQPEQADFPIRS